MGLKIKICSKCKRELPADTCRFYSAKNGKDGLYSTCKECKGQKFTKPKIKVKEGYKICSDCKKELPMTSEFFYKNNHRKDGFMIKCKTCSNLYSKKYIEIHKEAVKKKVEEYRESNKEVLRAKRKIYVELNKEHLREYNKQYGKKYYAENLKSKREKEIKRLAEYRKNNKAIISAYGKQYRKNNKEKINIRTNIHRARKHKLVATLTIKEWEIIKQYFNNSCCYCGVQEKTLEQEHIIPVTKGGGYTKQNIVPACRHCNSSKLNKDMEDWYRQQPYFSEGKLQKIYQWMGVKNNVQQLKII